MFRSVTRLAVTWPKTGSGALWSSPVTWKFNQKDLGRGVERSYTVDVENRVVNSRESLAIFGAPLSKGQRKSGVSEGPALIRSGGFVEYLKGIGWKVRDYGDLDFDVVENDPPIGNGVSKIKNPKTTGAAGLKISEAVQRALRENDVYLCLGGDHSLSIGSIHGHAQANSNLCAIWIDAHSDINTAETSPSGNIHGMAVAFCLQGLTHMFDLLGFEWAKPCLTAKDLVYIGLRDVDKGERDIIVRTGIKYFDMHKVDKYGIAKVLEMTLDHLKPGNDRPIHVSFDVDSLDTDVAPSTGTPVPGGLTLREALYVAQELHATQLVKGVDMVEVNPDLGNETDLLKTVRAVNNVLKAMFGKERHGNYAAVTKRTQEGA